MTATIHSIHRATWDTVREAHERAVKLSGQGVQAYAEVGDMLIDLKANTPHGEFQKRCAEALQIGNGVSDLDGATRKARTYMHIATNRVAWEPANPPSLREALKLIPSKPRPKRKTTAKVEPLPLSAKQKVQQAVSAELAQLRKDAKATLDKAVAERTRELAAHYTKVSEEAEERKKYYEELLSYQKPKDALTETEFDLILGLLHPDRHPPERSDRAAKAFNLVKSVKNRLLVPPRSKR